MSNVTKAHYTRRFVHKTFQDLIEVILKMEGSLIVVVVYLLLYIIILVLHQRLSNKLLQRCIRLIMFSGLHVNILKVRYSDMGNKAE